MPAPLALIAAGGTGGHMFPAQALAELLLQEGWRVRLSTDERGARYAGGFPEEVEREVVASATTARGGIIGKLTAPFKIAAGVAATCMAFRKDRPAVVIGFGGYPTIPALSAAVILGLPRMIHEQNGVMGRVNRLFSRKVHRIACGISATRFPDGVTAVYTGNPIRASVQAKAGATYIEPSDARLSLLVIGGSQGARKLSDVVPEAIAALPEELRNRLAVSHQARDDDRNRVTEAYRRAGVPADIQPFFDDVPERIAQAQLVISRAGASSIADITAIGRPSILIPLPSATGDHQTANAKMLTEAGAALIHPETTLDAESLSRDIRAILTEPERAQDMATAAAELGRPDAVQRLYAIVKEITE